MQEGRDMGIYVYVQLIHFVTKQKLTHHCKAIILQQRCQKIQKNIKHFLDSCVNHSIRLISPALDLHFFFSAIEIIIFFKFCKNIMQLQRRWHIGGVNNNVYLLKSLNNLLEILQIFFHTRDSTMSCSELQIYSKYI